MLRLTEVVARGEGDSTSGSGGGGVLTMKFDERRRSRMRARLDDGREAALLLPHGTILRDGDRLRAVEAGVIVAVRAAAQTLSIARTDDRAVADPGRLPSRKPAHSGAGRRRLARLRTRSRAGRHGA